jgi:hypothetical protein
MNTSQRFTLWANGTILALATVPLTLLAFLKGCEESLAIAFLMAAFVFVGFAGMSGLCFWGANSK